MKSFPIIAVAALGLSLAAGQTVAQTYGPGPDDQSYSGDQSQGSWQGQPQPPAYDQAQQRYQQQQQDYQEGQQQYRNQTAAYQARREAYADQQQDYQNRREQYERARADYDAEYGPGAFEAYWRPYPRAYDDRYGPGSYARDFGEYYEH